MTTANVIRFNWPKYFGAMALAAGALVAVEDGAPSWALAVGLPGGFWTLTSLGATWWVYDHGKVYQRLAAVWALALLRA